MSQLCALAAAYIVSSGIGTALATNTGDGARFAGIDLATEDIRRDFLIGAGTALSAPLLMLVAFASLVAVSATRHRERVMPLIAIVGVLFAIGQLGEPITSETLVSPLSDPTTTAVVVANIVLPAMVTLVAVRSIRRSRTAEAVAR